MPSGKTHDAITVITSPVVAGASYYFTKDITTAAIITGFYCFSGFMFSGDLDIKSVQSKRWGIFKFIWIPYRWFFPHRSFLSHGTLEGTITRTAYLLLCILGLSWGLNKVWPQSATSINPDSIVENIGTWIKIKPQTTMHIGIGLLLGSFSHSISDFIGSAIKKFRVRKKRHIKKSTRHYKKKH